MARAACGIKAHHAFTFVISESFLPMAEVVVEGFSRKGIVWIVRICPSSIGRRSVG